MAVHFQTDDPQWLLDAFNARIKQRALKGKITTWEPYRDGEHYTHEASRWRGKAWMRPRIGSRKLTFNVVNAKGTAVTPEVYAFYHGHLIETFINHFSWHFEHGIATALPTHEDRMGDEP